MIRLGSALYAHKEESVEVVSTKIGKTGIAGVGTSIFRGIATGAPKLSCIATLFDRLFLMANDLCAYESTTDETVYVEMGDVKAIASKDSIRYSDNVVSLKDKYRLIPHAILSLSSYGKNTELKESFSRICSTYNSMRIVNLADVLLFCDSYYYGCAKDIGEIDETNDLSDAEIEAAFRSGMYQSIPLMAPVSSFTKRSPFETGSTPKKKKRVAKEEGNFVQDCKDGKYRVTYDWPEEMKKYIIKPSFLDNFECTPEFEEIVKKIKFRSTKILERMDMGLTGADAIGKDYMNIMLLGKPGTGKTTLGYALSAATGMPVCTTVHTKHTDEDEYEGKTKIIDGHPAFCETESLVFHENGGIDICEEINLADPSVTMGGLGQKLEYPFIVKRNGYETKVRHPLNIVIATMNVGTNGSNPLNQALANRFKTPYILDDPTDETFINILMKSSGKSREICEWVYGAYSATVQYLKDPDVNEDEICQNLSIRTCLGAIDNMDEGQQPVRALINSIVGAVAVVDLEVARNLQHEKIECLPNPTFEI